MPVEVEGLELEVVSLSIPVGLNSEFGIGSKCHYCVRHLTGSKGLLRFLLNTFVSFVLWGDLFVCLLVWCFDFVFVFCCCVFVLFLTEFACLKAKVPELTVYIMQILTSEVHMILMQV